ncbi:TetR/AcrR family transcriptional regulator C-terminal ligand-binding domain-containing protein [Actinopolymorpha sp. B11F2]|uniref:TetR/AcrR family transcriptional regulator n=1 Tax=Actinopolymorpha sp. B11F2 TaxID=3160862 RepID=UPI0032E388E3
MEGVDQVRTRPGGRSAQVRERVFAAVREALEQGETAALSIDELARRSGIHRTTIYRRWLSTEGLIADLLIALTPVETPLPDTGDLRRDLARVARRVVATLEAPISKTMLPLIAGTTDPRLAEAAAGYWSSLFAHTAEIVRRAQERGLATREVRPIDAVESLLAPIYLRVLVTRQPTSRAFIDNLVTRSARMLAPGPEEKA